MFDGIAASYDRVNRYMSLGMDKGWRRKTVAALGLPRDTAGPVLDLAVGTADIAIEIARQHPLARVEGVDPSVGMLEVGRRKLERQGLRDRVTLHEGDAQALVFADDTFVGATIAFGIRNVPDRIQGLREMARVVKPGGRVVVLELTTPQGGPIAPAARFWVRHVVPRIGRLFASKNEYAYLRDSIGAFPAPSEFVSWMASAGLANIGTRMLGFGTVGVFSGTAPRGAPPDVDEPTRAAARKPL